MHSSKAASGPGRGPPAVLPVSCRHRDSYGLRQAAASLAPGPGGRTRRSAARRAWAVTCPGHSEQSQ